MIKVQRNPEYIQDLKELLLEQPDLMDEIDSRVQWFRKNAEDTRLKNHDLHKKMLGKFAFSITNDVRIVYKWLGKNEVRFLAIGGHPKVYK